MGKSIRSKKKRAFRAIKRQRYALKEKATLEQLLEKSNLKKYVEEYTKSKEEPIEDVEEAQPAESQTELNGGLQEMKDLSGESQPRKRNWDSKNQLRRKRKKEILLKQKSNKRSNVRFSLGNISKSSW